MFPFQPIIINNVLQRSIFEFGLFRPVSHAHIEESIIIIVGVANWSVIIRAVKLIIHHFIDWSKGTTEVISALDSEIY